MCYNNTTDKHAGGDRIDSIKWHLGFYGAAALELSANKADLVFHQEHNLGKEPLRIDLLIVKKLTDAVIQNEIGRIFRGYNIIEYKSPDDGLSIDDFYKTVGYACIYKGLGKTVNQVPAGELTVSIFRERYPAKMMDALQQSGMTVEQPFQGIYYVSGPLPFPVQVVATGQLTAAHHSLRVLSKHADETDVRSFLVDAASLSDPDDRQNIDAILEISMAANSPLYGKIGRSDIMCDALRELMKDDLVKAENKGILETQLKSLTNVMKSLSVDADKAMDILLIPAEERAIYRAKLP